MNIFGIDNHKMVHEDGLTQVEFLKHVPLITISVWRNISGAAVDGVGIPVEKQA